MHSYLLFGAIIIISAVADEVTPVGNVKLPDLKYVCYTCKLQTAMCIVCNNVPARRARMIVTKQCLKRAAKKHWKSIFIAYIDTSFSYFVADITTIVSMVN